MPLIFNAMRILNSSIAACPPAVFLNNMKLFTEGTFHPACSRRKPSGRKCLFIMPIFLLSCILHILCAGAPGHAGQSTVITSETLSYEPGEKAYTAAGRVRIERDGTVIEADQMTYHEESSHLTASGNIRYDDPDVAINAGRAEINLETKSGTIFDADIHYKKDNYRLSAATIVKTGDNYYTSPEAVFTTCDPPSPAWCFKGRDIKAELGDTLTAKDVSFRIRNIPVLYTPILWAPILDDRTTGFLFPYIGYSDSRGFQITMPFYWAISENRDMTFVIDEYTGRGLGTGAEYRYILPGNAEGKWWAYHIRDSKLRKNFFELRAHHDHRPEGKAGGFLNINFVSERDFYREYKTDFGLRTNRFLESTAEVAIPLPGSRVYLLSQYWIDLKKDMPAPYQRLPEAGCVLNSAAAGPFLVSGSASITNFWKEKGVRGQRADIFPKITHAFGKDVSVLQSLGLRETLYSLHGDGDYPSRREALEYHAAGHVRLFKKYESFSHILEPSVSYTLTALSGHDFPLFDSAELLRERSLLELSLLNRIVNDRGEYMIFRISQGFDARRGDRPFLPLMFDAVIRKPLSLRFGAEYNVYTGEMERVYSDLSVRILETTFMAGQRYNRLNNVNTYVAGVGLRPAAHLAIDGDIRYDAEQKETREIGLNFTYISQCWGISLGFVKRPGDFSVSFLFELKGITKTLKI